jgi:predicted TIM-barrel fold metal-dependent hydrolase
MATTTPNKVIDSHLHVWASAVEASAGFPYTQEPPEALKNKASITELLQQMDANGVDGALIVQPINHKYDHSYVLSAIKSHPDRFKGMLLHDPSLETSDAVARVEDLALQGFVGVRFNPYLWPKRSETSWEPMSQGAGLAVYKRCAQLQMPVGVMCFQGLDLHYDDILTLLKESPDTMLILDHFGFTSLKDDAVFDKLLALAAYPQVCVKISALFRLGDEPPYNTVKTMRFQPLLQAFGADRLLFGSDFPFVLEQPEAYGTAKLVASWVNDEQQRSMLMGGTAGRLFGTWGTLEENSEL